MCRIAKKPFSIYTGKMIVCPARRIVDIWWDCCAGVRSAMRDALRIRTTTAAIAHTPVTCIGTHLLTRVAELITNLCARLLPARRVHNARALNGSWFEGNASCVFMVHMVNFW